MFEKFCFSFNPREKPSEIGRPREIRNNKLFLGNCKGYLITKHVLHKYRGVPSYKSLVVKISCRSGSGLFWVTRIQFKSVHNAVILIFFFFAILLSDKTGKKMP